MATATDDGLWTGLAVLPEVWHGVTAHACGERPNECCGLLGGRIVAGWGVVQHFWPVVNALASPVAYRTEPRSLLAAFRGLRQTGAELLAVYHSHPTGPPVPSRRDLAENTYGAAIAHCIIAWTDDDRPLLTAWRLLPDRAVPLPCRLLPPLPVPTDPPLRMLRQVLPPEDGPSAALSTP